MKPMIFLLCNTLFIYQVLCTLIYRRRSLYSFLLIHTIMYPTEYHISLLATNISVYTISRYTYPIELNVFHYIVHCVICTFLPHWEYNLFTQATCTPVCKPSSYMFSFEPHTFLEKTLRYLCCDYLYHISLWCLKAGRLAGFMVFLNVIGWYLW